MIFLLVYLVSAVIIHVTTFHKIVSLGVYELFGLEITMAGIYVAFILFGIFCHFLHILRRLPYHE